MSAHATTSEPARASSRPRDLDARAQLKLWLQVLDTLLTAVEKSAWQVRELGQSTLETAQGVKGAFERLLLDARSHASTSRSRLQRLTSASLTLARVVASYRLHTTKAAFTSRAGAQRAAERLHDENARRLHALCVRQGGALLKVAQILSTRPDLLPAPYIRELSKLQDAAPYVPLAAIMTVLEAELGAPLEDIFAAFEHEPLAAASIGQVHRATLLDGREVAVKVQRPGIAELVALDLELLEHFARAMSESLPPVDMDTILRETRAMIFSELDYRREAAATERVATFFGSDGPIRAPQVVAALCTERVLVTEFMAGQKITDVLDQLLLSERDGDEEARPRITTLLSRVLEAYVRQTLELGLFQADPHPGNLLATADGELVVLDFGCAKELSPTQRAGLVELASGFCARDPVTMARALSAIGFTTRSGSAEAIERYAQTVLDEIGVVRARGGGWPTQLELISQTTLMARFIGDEPVVQLPEEFVMLGRVFGTLSGLFLHYRPDVAAAARILPQVLMALATRPV